MNTNTWTMRSYVLRRERVDSVGHSVSSLYVSLELCVCFFIEQRTWLNIVASAAQVVFQIYVGLIMFTGYEMEFGSNLLS